VSCRPNWFLPVRVLGRVFRGKYLAALRAAYQAGELQFAGSTAPLATPAAWDALVRALYQKEWVVYAKEPFGGPEVVLKYLTGYTHRVALSNHRLVKLEDDRVTFVWKDYADGCRRKEMTLDAVEFVRRFALHIVPRGLVRIRRYGLLAHRDRDERLTLCRSLLGVEASSAGPAGLPAAGDANEAGQSGGGALDAGRALEPSPARRVTAGLLVLAVWITLARGAEGRALARAVAALANAPSPVVAECCPSCVLGRLETIWQAPRPTRAEREPLRHEDSS
jgi:hypothetical protein